MISHFYERLTGYFDYGDLYRDAVRALVLPDTRDNVFVELGVFHGRSLAFLAVELANHCEKVGSTAQLYGFDSFKATIQGSAPSSADELQELFFEFSATNTLIIDSDSSSAANTFRDGSVSFVFVDADHKYEGVKRDIDAWLPKIKRGGIIAGHDMFDPEKHTRPVSLFMGIEVPAPIDPFPGVRKAVLEVFSPSQVEIIGRSWRVQL